MSDQPTMQLPPEREPGPGTGHNRALRTALIAALTTFVLVLPVAVLLLVRYGGDTTGPGTSQPATPAVTTPQTSGGSTPAAPATTSAPRPPDGRIALGTLREATLTIPRWPADNVQGPHGRLRFHHGIVSIAPKPAVTGKPPVGGEIVILAVTYGDLDRDGAEETIAEIGCLIEGGSKQLVAFDRDPAGQIVTMGTVVATTGEIRDIASDSATVRRDGTIAVRLSDYQRCCDDRTPQVWQTRGYGWDHGRFRQVSGPARLPANPAVTQTSLSAGDLILGPAVDGYRYGTVTVTLAHRWGARPRHLVVTFYPEAGLERAGTAWPPVTAQQGSFSVILDPPAVRGSKTVSYAFRRPAATPGGHLDIDVSGLSAGNAPLSEAIPFDNIATAAIRTVN
ncbi:hypothetical protein AB0C12_26885 [Actinoplanes sp. NPDC048967]|uniref:hypothetical protein n=1 Tax=Actinoplanes sp. NPDC048967 TaxID=3155269 RepID=UPI0033DDB6B6